MTAPDPVVKVELNLRESGTLCHALLDAMNANPGGVEACPRWIIELYAKLAKANDKLMHK